MPDIVDLLEETARAASAGPDLAWLEKRARGLRQRNRALQALAVTAIVAAVSGALTLPDGRDALQQQPATRPTITAEPQAGSPRTAAPASELASAAPASAGSDQPAEVPGPSLAVGIPAPAGTSQPRGAVPRAGAAYPAAQSCHVSTRDVQGGPSWVCRFTATKAGGWSITRSVGVFAGYDPATYTVTVERRGTTVYSYDGDDTECANEVIRPGDRVAVSLMTHSTSMVEDIDVGAGTDYGC